MTVNWENIREEQFPALKKKVHLKSAGGSPISKKAYDAGVEYLNEMLKYGDVCWDRYFDELEFLKAKVANYFNAKPSEIAFLMNTSSCVNVIAHLLAPSGLLYPEGEFPSSIHIFKRLKYNCKKIENINQTYSLDDFRKACDTNSRYVIHSHVQYLTGFRQDLVNLGKFCIENSLTNIINATQSFGVFPINVKEQKIDALVASALKWACCGYGVGILYISKKIIKEHELPFSSWLSVKDAFSMDNDNLDLIQKTSSMDGLGGTPNFPPLLTLRGGLKLIEEIGNGDLHLGLDKISQRIFYLTSEFIKEIESLDYKIITPLNIENRSGIITIEHENAEEIYNELFKNDILISLRNYPKFTKKTLLRFAFNYYNNLEDIEKSITILKQFKPK